MLDVGGAKAPEPRRRPQARTDEGDDPTSDQALPPGLAARPAASACSTPRPVPKQTRPPPRFTDATLLTAMETAGRTLDEKELADAMQERGLGTPATRAAIIETLLAREYVVRQGKSLEATDKGIGLDRRGPPRREEPGDDRRVGGAARSASSAARATSTAFMARIEAYVREVVGAAWRVAGRPAPAPPAPTRERSGQPLEARRLDAAAASAPRDRPRASSRARRRARVRRRDRRTALASTAPRARRPAAERLRLRDFRPHQEAVCRAATDGQDVLLVMPTGAGKSLCYQLPGLARGGTTLVVSPLIALMEDQVAQARRR